MDSSMSSVLSTRTEKPEKTGNLTINLRGDDGFDLLTGDLSLSDQDAAKIANGFNEIVPDALRLANTLSVDLYVDFRVDARTDEMDDAFVEVTDPEELVDHVRDSFRLLDLTLQLL